MSLQLLTPPPASYAYTSAFGGRPMHINPTTMGEDGTQLSDGASSLDIQRALDIARNTEGDLDPTISDYLENQLADVWTRVQAQPDEYILTKDEFAVFNYYIVRFDGSEIAEKAVARFWHNHQENEDQMHF